MANTKSAIKAARKSARNATRNKAIQTRLKTLRKSYEQALAKGDAAAARTIGTSYAAAVDKAAKKGIIHKNAASNAKSHVAKSVMTKAKA
jgi:small subunit ribosomal protein S20